MIITVEMIKVVKIKNFDNKLSKLNAVSKKHRVLKRKLVKKIK